jgi:hypothetical protein
MISEMEEAIDVSPTDNARNQPSPQELSFMSKLRTRSVAVTGKILANDRTVAISNTAQKLDTSYSVNDTAVGDTGTAYIGRLQQLNTSAPSTVVAEDAGATGTVFARGIPTSTPATPTTTSTSDNRKRKQDSVNKEETPTMKEPVRRKWKKEVGSVSS